MKLFVEGGSAVKRIRTDFQQGFRALVGKVTMKMPRIVACGSRENALDKFCTELRRGGKALLLVDSERPVKANHIGKPWAHLAGPSDNWRRPESAGDDNAHLMAQCMESWFVADPEALAAHFGQGFKPEKLRGNPNVEEIPKSDILSGLSAATKESGREYQKTHDGFALIGKIDPSRVAKRAPHAERFFGVLRQEFGAREGKE